MAKPLPQFVDLQGPANRAIWASFAFLAAQLAIGLGCLYNTIIFRRYLDWQASEADLNFSFEILKYIGVGSILVLLIVYIINARFLFLASRNAQVTAPMRDAISPGWSIGYFAIPIVNLWMPYRAIRETWSRTLGPSRPHPKWLIIWWLSWVALLIFDRVLSRWPEPQSPEELLRDNNLFIANSIAWIVPTFFFIKIIQALRDGSRAPAGPPPHPTAAP